MDEPSSAQAQSLPESAEDPKGSGGSGGRRPRAGGTHQSSSGNGIISRYNNSISSASHVGSPALAVLNRRPVFNRSKKMMRREHDPCRLTMARNSTLR